MTIICISAFDKVSRFYIDIQKELKKTTSAKIKILSLYFSGYLYTLMRFNSSSWISFKAWVYVLKNKERYKRILSESNVYKGLETDKMIRFHESLSTEISKEHLLMQAMAYIDIFEKLFKKSCPDCILCLGDSRLPIKVAITLAKNNNILVKYIEQGPYGSIFYDHRGVNANLSIRNTKATTMVPPIQQRDTTHLEINTPYKRSPIYRGFDLLFMSIFEKTTFYPPDLKFTDVNSFISNNKKCANGSSFLRPSVLFILQLPIDVNIKLHSPLYQDQFEALREVHQKLPKSVELVVREHPLYAGKYERELYNYLEKHRIPIDKNTDLEVSVKSSKFVIVINSTVGYEAICNYKPTVVLGDAFYDRAGLCLKLTQRDQLQALLESALTFHPDKSQIDAFVDQLHQTVLIKGGMKDRDLRSSKVIARDLIALL